MTCRCGHGLHLHRVDQAASRRRRRKGLTPTNNLKCGRCACRNYFGPDGPLQGRWGRPAVKRTPPPVG